MKYSEMTGQIFPFEGDKTYHKAKQIFEWRRFH